ncbi:helix-turn-helix transcriptional regulator [Mycolicibacterium cosmeticum]
MSVLAIATLVWKRQSSKVTGVSRSKWTDKRFGDLLRKERTDRKWTQPQMAEMLDMHPTVLAKIEKGARSVRIVEAAVIADLLGVSLDSLLGRRSGVANEVADIVANLKTTAGKAVMDIAGLHNAIQGWFTDLGDLDFAERPELERAGGSALKALVDAQDALYGIAAAPAPQRVAMKRLNEAVERRATEMLIGMLKEIKESEAQS